MKKLFALATFASVFFSQTGSAMENFRLICNDFNIFEGPLVVLVRGESAMVNGNFSGPGDAIFNVRYAPLAVFHQSNGVFTIERGAVVGQPHDFVLNLREEPTALGQPVQGYVQMISSDSNHMPYSGRVECEIK